MYTKQQKKKTNKQTSTHTQKHHNKHNKTIHTRLQTKNNSSTNKTSTLNNISRHLTSVKKQTHTHLHFWILSEVGLNTVVSWSNALGWTEDGVHDPHGIAQVGSKTTHNQPCPWYSSHQCHCQWSLKKHTLRCIASSTIHAHLSLCDTVYGANRKL